MLMVRTTASKRSIDRLTQHVSGCKGVMGCQQGCTQLVQPQAFSISWDASLVCGRLFSASSLSDASSDADYSRVELDQLYPYATTYAGRKNSEDIRRCMYVVFVQPKLNE